MARAVEQQMCEFNPQNVANTAWAFATVDRSDEKLFTALAKATDLWISELGA